MRGVFGIASFALACALAVPGPTAAADSTYSPEATAIDNVCNAYRSHAHADDFVRLARVGGIDAPWMTAGAGAVARAQESSTFVAGDFVTIVLDHGALVSADLSHLDGPTGRIVLHAWCFIGGKLSRASAEVYLTYDRSTGYTKTRYYGDDLDQPLAEYRGEKWSGPKSNGPPSKDIDALLVVEPDAKPPDLPFYDAFQLARKGALPHLK